MRIALSTTDGVEAEMLDTVCKRMEDGYLSLYKDNQYTFFGNHVSSVSHWKFDKAASEMVIDSFIGGIQLRFKVLEYSDKWLRMNLTGFGKNVVHGEEHTLLFAFDPHFEHEHVDLMTRDMNTWRVRPGHKESKAEIKKRVIAHIDFMIAYYQLIEDAERNSFEPMYLQSTVKFYQNGIGTENEYNIHRGWVDCFYDTEDAVAGWRILGDAVKSMPAYPSAKNYTEGYLKALKLMKEYLEKVN